ncbi:GGDEF domain-containing protein [Gordonia sputi]|uniref:GGDEF domain-containing protein n=1 Tax=Gordonia sputi NBRC 100414 TaxID=1089453 RepID=H5TYV0_9ACTN|nr:GGDEF domain-containing protein [Gordonia sputi]NKY92273.1 GGDEF domain-containing protein [Gordonia sputi]GAB38658.1 hypothetical protein GOSPT_048_00380 [Gordonia sputi NBRC 100414]
MRFGIPNTARQLLKTDEYEWLVSYLTSRGLLRWSRWLVAIDGATIGVTAMLAALAPPGVLWPYGNLVMVGLAVAGICWSARWLLGRWPSHLESLVLIAAADIGVATACFAHHNLVLGVAATPLFAATGAYIAFFHSTAANICHIVFAVTVVVTAVVASAFVQGPQWLPVAMSKGLIALLLTALVLPFLRIAYSMFRSSADASAVDSLTGLLNRRGLRQEVAKAEIESPDSPPWTVVAVDLDNFEAVNDIYGHQRGDDVLVAVADLLRRCQVPGTHTLIVRLGGDEFAMALRATKTDAERLAARVLHAISQETDLGVSASVGVATGHPDSDVFELVASADTAMYTAKRSGGDQAARVTLGPGQNSNTHDPDNRESSSQGSSL